MHRRTARPYSPPALMMPTIAVRSCARVTGAADFLQHAGVFEFGFQRHRVGELAVFDAAHHGLEDAAMGRINPVFRGTRKPLVGAVVGQQCAQQRLLRLQVGWRQALGGTEEGQIDGVHCRVGWRHVGAGNGHYGDGEDIGRKFLGRRIQAAPSPQPLHQRGGGDSGSASCAGELGAARHYAGSLPVRVWAASDAMMVLVVCFPQVLLEPRAGSETPCGPRGGTRVRSRSGRTRTSDRSVRRTTT